jgi:ubiquinone/menaquinone biosynthesis C-methylase UbiE
MVASSPAAAKSPLFVPETRFGVWFLGTDTWFNFVLKAAVRDLYRLMDHRTKSYPVIVDVGCGQGRSFPLLKMAFRPNRLIGVEMEDENLEIARKRAAADGIPVDFLENDCAAIDLADESADIVFCHQTLHHLVQQEKSLSEFYRILKPGGVLLLAESTRAYIHSWIIRWLFAHPMDVQRTADEYVEMIKKQGFELEPRHVSFPYLWWSRPDFGVVERLGIPPKKRGEREETLVNLVARKPT